MVSDVVKAMERYVVPCVADTNDMIHVTQSELEQLVREDTGSIRKSKKTMIRKDRPQAHGPRM